MAIEFNFKSQIATTREQSERLIALGLKKETADMALIENWDYDLKDGKFFTGEYFERPIDYTEGMTGHYIPAWSLHRLWELDRIHDITLDSDDEIATLYDEVINNIEAQIKEGNFNKEYLEHGAAQ